jgi:SAM-dependent methyltransferase
MSGERRFAGTPERLRREDRVQLLEVDRVIDVTLEGINAASALDVGTGSGIFAEAFVKRGLAVTGIDPNPEMIAASRMYVPAATFVDGVMEAIPAADKSFDIVFMGHVLHETDNIVGALGEARRCARQRAVVLEWPYRVDEYRPPLEHRLRPEQIAGAAREAGFTNIRSVEMTSMQLFVLS